MVSLDQAEKNVRNAQNELDQALKELEKAKKPKVWEKVFHGGCCLSKNDPSAFLGMVVDGFNYPCKVTVRPLGGPERVIVSEHLVASLPKSVRDDCYRAGLDGRQLVRLVVEELE